MTEKFERYFRPVWTCGRYDAKSQSAIMFNLMSGMNYFFEDKSADIIGKILSIPRDGEFSSIQLSESTGIHTNVLNPFLMELSRKGLLSEVPITPEITNEYRNFIFYSRKEQTIQDEESRNVRESNV